MVSVGLVLGVVFGAFAVVVAGSVYIFYRCGWWANPFGPDDVEMRGVPLESRVPHITEEQRSMRLRQLRRAQRRRQRRAETREANGGNDAGGGSISPATSSRTRGSNSRWFRRRQSLGSETCTTVASSGVVYGHGRYLSPSSATEPSPRSQRWEEGKTGGEHQRACHTRQQQRNARRRMHGGHNTDGDGDNAAFGGWADSVGSSSSTSSSGTDRSSRGTSSGSDGRPNIEVVSTPPKRERQFATRISAIEHNAALSGFFTTPAAEWSREPYGCDCPPHAARATPG